MINLVLADADSRYTELFIHYLRNSQYSNKVTAKAFTNKENLEKFDIESGKYILLVSPELLPTEQILQKYQIVMILADLNNLEGNYNYPVIAKFQPLNKLTEQVINFFLDKNESIIFNPNINLNLKVISIYSANGGIGKTTLAVNLAKELAYRGKKVFYLNLEYLDSSDAFFPANEEKNFSRFLYYLKANLNTLPAKIEPLKSHYSNLNLDYFGPPSNSEEILEITEKEIEDLILTFRNYTLYDYLIIDLESSFHERIRGALHNSDLIFWLVLDDKQSIIKNQKLLKNYVQAKREYNSLEIRIKFVLNRYLGSEIVNQELKKHFDLSGKLPYIPQWKAVNDSEMFLKSRAFNEEVVKLINLIN